MNKTRLEAISDGIFAIVMTLLVIEIKVPELHGHFSEEELLHQLQNLTPLFLAFFLSFAVLTSYWITHHFLVTVMAKNASRNLAYLNMLLFAFVSLIPFSSHLLGTYSQSKIAVSFYSFNVLIIAITLWLIRFYIIRSERIENPDFLNLQFDAKGKYTTKDALYGTARLVIAISSSILAIFISFISTQAAIALLLIPVLLGIIPGLLAFTLKVTGIERIFVNEEVN